MKKELKDYLGGAEWHFNEFGWESSRQGIDESLFALGNGNIGSRGILEELPTGVKPGTFFSGIYDKTSSQVQELVNAPNPINLQISIEGEKLDVSAMDVIDHERILDINQGILYRRTVFQTTVTKNKILYESLRFFSMANPNIACMKVAITPLEHSTQFTLKSTVDTDVANSGLITEGLKRHFFIHEFSKLGDINYLCTKTLEHEVLLGYSTMIQLTINRKTKSQTKRMFRFSLRKGQTAMITKYISFVTSNEVPATRVKSQSIKTLKNALSLGFEKLIDAHSNAWRMLWKRCDFLIEGDHELHRGIKYNIFHLLSTGSKHMSNDVSVGARCLSGEGYRGHIFWDVEIFVLPFFIYTFPNVAKKLLLYRYNRLDAARKNAKSRGYSGAMFPWESAHDGDDVTPTWHKDFDGRMIKIHTMQQEHHITADVAYAVWHYYQATHDDEFIINYGLEILLESAQFWNSRVIRDKKRRCYVINEVIGPDEFHEKVNNNAYTNQLAKWNLLIAKEAVDLFLRKSSSKTRKLLKKLKLTQKEIEEWGKVAHKIYLPELKKNKIIEQFEGFFKKKKYPLPGIDSSGLPTLPKKVALENIGKTQFVKQADVILLFYLFPSLFSSDVALKNFEYYESRTLHKSSLSASMHSLMAARLGMQEMAYRYLQISARTDLDNLYGNTFEGIHAASLGGTWQAFVNGFCGIGIKKGELSMSPFLPKKWKRIEFQLCWRGGSVDIEIDSNEVKVQWRGKGTLSLYVYNQLVKLKRGKWGRFERESITTETVEMKGIY